MENDIRELLKELADEISFILSAADSENGQVYVSDADYARLEELKERCQAGG